MIWRGKKRERLVFAIMCVTFAMSLATQALAHKIHVIARTEGRRVFVEAFFVDGKNVSSGKVDIMLSSGAVVLQGVTDREGLFSFEVVEARDLEIAITDDAGHRGTYLVKKDDFYMHPGGEIKRASPAGVHDTTGESAPDSTESKMKGVVIGKVLEENVERKVDPIRQELREIRKIVDRPAVKDIVGGLGYIAGLAGLLFFIFGRKKAERK